MRHRGPLAACGAGAVPPGEFCIRWGCSHAAARGPCRLRPAAHRLAVALLHQRQHFPAMGCQAGCTTWRVSKHFPNEQCQHKLALQFDGELGHRSTRFKGLQTSKARQGNSPRAHLRLAVMSVKLGRSSGRCAQQRPIKARYSPTPPAGPGAWKFPPGPGSCPGPGMGSRPPSSTCLATCRTAKVLRQLNMAASDVWQVCV